MNRRAHPHRTDRADGSIIGAILMLALVATLVPGLVMLKTNIDQEMDAQATTSYRKLDEVKLKVVGIDAQIAAAETLEDQYVLEAAQAAADIVAAQNRVSNAAALLADANARIAVANTEVTDLALEIRCRMHPPPEYDPLPPDPNNPALCPAPIPPSTKYYIWWDEVWTCKSFGIPNQQTCTP